MGRESTAFIGFTFRNLHSIDNFHVYRTSDGSRYNYNLIPQLNDKTAEVPGGHGQYFFGSTYKTRQFSIPIAFEELSETEFNDMKDWLSGTEIGELSFDERTEVKYSAKVTGTPQLKVVCFDKNGQNIYKGEGTIQFTCYFPFGYGEDEIQNWNNTTTENKTISETVPIGGDLPTTFIFTGTDIDGEIQVGNLHITPTSNTIVWDSKTGLVTSDNTPIGYTGISYGTIGPNNITINFTLKPNGTASFTRKKLYY